MVIACHAEPCGFLVLEVHSLVWIHNCQNHCMMQNAIKGYTTVEGCLGTGKDPVHPRSVSWRTGCSSTSLNSPATANEDGKSTYYGPVVRFRRGLDLTMLCILTSRRRATLQGRQVLCQSYLYSDDLTR